MTNLNNNELSARTNLHNFCNTVKAGLHNAVVSPSKRHALLVLLLLGAALCAAIYWPYHLPAALAGLMLVPAAFTYLCWAAVSAAAVGYVPGALEMQHNFARIGFTNSAGEAPYLIQKEQRGNAAILTYHCTGFPVSAWIDKQLELESALNMLIASVKEGDDRRTVSLCCVPPEHVFDTIEWHERYILRNEDNKLILGRGLTGDVIIDIDKTPHILIGGNTGSGKSVLVQCLLWQAIQQADVVYVADFKGGVDFSYVWQEFAYIITEETKLLVLLNHLADTLEERKRLFKKVDAANITEYREKSGDYMQRIVFACDEVAELLDKTGADKARKELLAQIQEMGVKIAHVTLHVGLGTFRPVKVSNVLDHHMHSEFYRIEEDAANMINETKKNGGRIICVGTTSCRTIESAAAEDGTIRACSGWTDIFIYPGYQFKILDCLITNFHLPESTLVMLVSALAGREHVLTAYEEAIRQRYRFFSFGDAMFIQ